MISTDLTRYGTIRDYYAGPFAGPACGYGTGTKHLWWCLVPYQTDHENLPYGTPSKLVPYRQPTRHHTAKMHSAKSNVLLKWEGLRWGKMAMSREHGRGPDTPTPTPSLFGCMKLSYTVYARTIHPVLRTRRNVTPVPIGGKWCRVRAVRLAHLVLDRRRQPVHYTDGGRGRSITRPGGGRPGREPRTQRGGFWIPGGRTACVQGRWRVG